jgi:AICAR transformylase/IMP cyclohydrolase PurH
MPRALLSVYNKSGLVEFANTLIEMGWGLVASGGTEKMLSGANLPSHISLPVDRNVRNAGGAC